jgi:hypothetical protein
MVSNKDVVFVQWPAVRKSHLYVMYWSGAESFEVTSEKPMEARLASVPRDRRVFLLRDPSLVRRAESGGVAPAYELVRVR